MNKKKPKFALGTVQFGRNYGFKNTKIKKQEEINQILNLSKKSSILLLDTAPDYSESERKIGKYKRNPVFKIVTKTATIKSSIITEKEIKFVENKFYDSLKKMKRKKVYSLLIHTFNDILKPGSENLIELLQKIKKKGNVEKIGISLYEPKQFYKALSVFKLDIVQFPLNILDQRFLKIKFSMYKDIEFHARSLFLQGLLLQDIENIPDFFIPIKQKLKNIRNFFRKRKINELESSLLFALQQKNINYFILGVDSYTQFEQITKILKKRKIQRINFSQFSSRKNKFTDPRNWKF